MVLDIESNNNFSQAQDLGTFSSSSNGNFATGSVSMTDVNDVYKFRLNAPGLSDFTSNLQLNLTQIDNGNNDVDIELFQDINGNNQIDSGDLVVNAFDQPQTEAKRLTLRGMDNATYFVRVRKDRGPDVGTGQSSYRLDVTSQATIGQEQEPNNSILQPDIIEGNLNDYRRFQGSVNQSSDVTDFYTFQVETPSQFGSFIIPQGGSENINFFMAKDFNNNGILEGNEFAVSRNFFDNGFSRGFSNENLEPGTYFLQVGTSSASSGTVNYDLTVRATPLNRAELSVKVERLTAIDNFEGQLSGEADFRITTSINGSSSSKKIDDKNDAFFNFDVVRSVSTNQRFIPFTISAKEEDLSSGDEKVDINPNSNRGLSLTYDSLTGRITGEGIMRSEDNLITLEGNNSDERARIQFRVNYRSFT